MNLAHEADLDQMIGLIREDCRSFGMEESRINTLISDVLIKGSNNNDFSFQYRDQTGYTLTFWERGFCNWGISSFDGMEFRFLFQRHIVLHDFADPEETNKFMSDAQAIFGQTEEYRKAMDDIQKKRKKDELSEGSLLVFRTDGGSEYRFVWTGVMHYYPNKSSASGYGSDDWMYLCKMDDHHWILRLTYGPPVWICLPIPETDAEQIRQTAGEALRSVYNANWDQNRLILHLHPKDTGLIRNIVIPDYHRNGLLTDRDLYGI